ncbi:hypothetical protein Z517_00907 [Fonsecaea pedrosoi CBS 271.37]|uniref:DUF1680 domain protein n=1 Tax=Fonsecaea pedrosoi CBS 271.37 TaxID=1442368 RepID=A0A0D2H3T2_9EURO|nr:uncharacterized protein Z517_00907 [Fonsecaea pedrosoi CBS 271.37]KIW85515.1 hypothetical protein Z517_00907 [Fonsecaea pedrosoi CBS 271.37]
MVYPQETFMRTSITPGSLIARRREAVASETLFHLLRKLKETGRYDAFDMKWHPSYKDPPKWIEGACYFLPEHPDAMVELVIKELVQMIQKAQAHDGYLNIHFMVVELGQRFTNLRDLHELYNAGHLIEAALAHNYLYKNNDLLDPILKYVELLCKRFGRKKGQIPGYPGHPEIELALLRLYHRTRNPKHLELATFFISERGNPAGIDGSHFFRYEAKKRGEAPHVILPYWGQPDALWYYQAHKPIVEQETIEGHSVRAMYLLTAAADLVRLDPTSDGRLKDAIYRLWTNMVECKMYVTGGIGAIKQWEGFGLDYFLPQGTDEGGCYSETCAAIGVMMLAERILQFDVDRRFSDVMELSLYNAVLTAVSHDGTRFSYANQLASSNQDPSERAEWFTCACCPLSVLRLLGQIGGYVYTQTAENPHRINVHLYISSTYEFRSGAQLATLSQRSQWPWDGKVDFTLQTQSPLVAVDVALRIPGWATEWTLDPAPPTYAVEKGYLILTADWLSTYRSFSLNVDISPRLVAPHPYTNQDTLAVVRGPVVYCVEDVDNPWVDDHFKSTLLHPACSFVEKTVTDATTRDTYVALTTEGVSKLNMKHLHACPGVVVREPEMQILDKGVITELNFVPYYFKANRGGRGHARVGLRRWY